MTKICSTETLVFLIGIILIEWILLIVGLIKGFELIQVILISNLTIIGLLIITFKFSKEKGED